MLLSHKDLLYQIEEDGTAVTIYKNNDAKTYTAIEATGELAPHHFCVLNYIKVDMNHSETFEERILSRTAALNDVHGFISLRILRPLDPQNHYVVISLWDDRKSFEVWQDSKQPLNYHNQCHGVMDNDIVNSDLSYNIKFDTK
ncbi:antibiotic biosynthesis monooxygenase family protein [Staphylococcus intermedius]|uniref:Signal transduction protein TRAP n=1 Tax=Staphylococcus intermedius NCTC 11048 TaxID=1141106 RepID=A0A380G494_STAIN|nr:antibiotic biosynthesis monooxygenase family protein [Staphylococcus intermedius]PCF64341.1 antibiotic biosynthesis monooxygenase [Staphylococcus intermedius]PCF79057.1 antibiotic biosynthesis monooxygenase [Staphylococcus intermedius]PCF80029.1 antibiotic biosynthesis monooxygenase [Staphylococcus intermedius]PCF89310.1 antibiotic biosynthesis monooxygenase [Staphylococcus intermedius]PNZ53123.1 antibiotic biosynthesis monooxygenase [Staphylococcus intermedius NCTC 11048]